MVASSVFKFIHSIVSDVGYFDVSILQTSSLLNSPSNVSCEAHQSFGLVAFLLMPMQWSTVHIHKLLSLHAISNLWVLMCFA